MSIDIFYQLPLINIMIYSIERIHGDILRQGLTSPSNFQKFEPNLVHTFQTNFYIHRLKTATWASILTLYLVQHICQGCNLYSKNFFNVQDELQWYSSFYTSKKSRMQGIIRIILQN